MYNKYARARPHMGHIRLRDLIWRAKKEEKYWVYHAGVDKLYLKSDFSPDHYTQAKGSIHDWQCRACNILNEDIKFFDFALNRISGEAM